MGIPTTKAIAGLLCVSRRHARRLKAAKDPRVKRAERAWRAEQKSKRSKLDELGIDWTAFTTELNKPLPP